MPRAGHSDADAIRRDYAHLAAEYERRWADFNATARDWVLAHWPDLPANARVLDIGCGTGAWLETLARQSPGYRLAGLDLSPAQLTEARRRLPAVTLIEADAQQPPFIAGAFDAVCSLNVMHHLADPRLHLRTLAALGRPGASVFLVTFARTRTLATRLASRWLLWRNPAWRKVLSTAGLRDMIAREPGLSPAAHAELRGGRFWYLQGWQLTVT